MHAIAVRERVRLERRKHRLFLLRMESGGGAFGAFRRTFGWAQPPLVPRVGRRVPPPRSPFALPGIGYSRELHAMKTSLGQLAATRQHRDVQHDAVLRAVIAASRDGVASTGRVMVEYQKRELQHGVKHVGTQRALLLLLKQLAELGRVVGTVENRGRGGRTTVWQSRV